MVAGAFLPWGRSGRVDRSSFALVRSAERLDLLDGAAATAARAWYLVPALGALVWLAHATRRAVLAAVLGTVLACGGVGLVVAVRRSPLVPRAGTSVTIAGAAAIVIGVAIGWVGRMRGSGSEMTDRGSDHG